MSTDITITFPAERLDTVVKHLKAARHTYLADDLQTAINIGRAVEAGKEETFDPDLVTVTMHRKQWKIVIEGRKLIQDLMSRALKARNDPEWDEVDRLLQEQTKPPE